MKTKGEHRGQLETNVKMIEILVARREEIKARPVIK